MATKTTKTDAVLKLLERKQGATVAQLQKATGWQPHSVPLSPTWGAASSGTERLWGLRDASGLGARDDTFDPGHRLDAGDGLRVRGARRARGGDGPMRAGRARARARRFASGSGCGSGRPRSGASKGSSARMSARCARIASAPPLRGIPSSLSQYAMTSESTGMVEKSPWRTPM